MIPIGTTRKGPAIAGALLLSGCADASAFHDTYYVVTRPLELLIGYLTILCLALAAWRVILKLSEYRPRRGFTLAMTALAAGFALSALPTLMLVSGSVWPEITIVLRLAGLGGALILLTVAGTAILLVWHLIAALARRG